jgi:hypothetical protein
MAPFLVRCGRACKPFATAFGLTVLLTGCKYSPNIETTKEIDFICFNFLPGVVQLVFGQWNTSSDGRLPTLHGSLRVLTMTAKSRRAACPGNLERLIFFTRQINILFITNDIVAISYFCNPNFSTFSGKHADIHFNEWNSVDSSGNQFAGITFRGYHQCRIARRGG